MKSTFRIGSKTVTAAEVFSASEPTHQEMAMFCDMLGSLIVNRVVLLKSILATSTTVSHPWLLYILARMNEKIREGSGMTGSIVKGLQELVVQRASELARTEIENRDWNPGMSWCIPDFFGFFGDLIALVNAGEESGETDTALFRVRDINLAEGRIGRGAWTRNVGLFLSVVELMHCAGIPIVDCLKKARVASSLQSEIDIVISEIESEVTLAEALAKTNGQLANPVLINIIEASESRGELEMTLHSIVTQKPLRQIMASEFV